MNKATTQITTGFYSNHTLSYEELVNPLLVIDRLFDFGKIDEIRELLWLSFRATIIGDYPKKLTRNQRNDIVSLYEFIEKLVEAAHLIYVDKKEAAPQATSSTQGDEPVFYPYLPEHINKVNIESHCSEEGNIGSNLLFNIVQTIAEFTNVEKIFLVNSVKQADWSQHFNLLVILPESSPLTYVHCQHLIEKLCAKWGHVLAWCSKWQTVGKALEEGHIFYSAVCTPDKLLYTNSPLAIPGKKMDIDSIKKKAQVIFNHSYDIATSFIDGARYYITTKQYPTAAFMLHQAMEHGLRALLYSLTAHYKYGHNISTSLKLCTYCAPEIEMHFPQNSQAEIELFDLLKNAYVHPRYTPGYHISEEKLLLLMDRVDSLHTDLPQFFDENVIWFEEMMQLTAEESPLEGA